MTARSAATSSAKAVKAKVTGTATAVIVATKSKDANAAALFTVSNAIPGVGITADAAALRVLAARPDVVKITPIVPKRPDNAHAAQLTKVLNTWQDNHLIGTGVTVGVIDTGIDYTHADFGGVGTVAAYNAALKTDSAPLFKWRQDLPAAAQQKIADGWDFVGDNYNADPAAADYQPIPKPDPNPLDCVDHGTHVAGTVAGYGVNADGSTFSGSYTGLTANDLDAMQIGPGMAPDATLYSFKVFGCTGSTDVVIPALDMALDPNGDSDFSDHLDIVNLSLGSDYSAVDDPENAVVDVLAANGVLPVIAMGNNGDLTDTGGSPGNAVRSLAVASSVDDYQLLSGIQVNAPVSVAGVAVGQASVQYDWANAPDVTGDVVKLSAGNADGCSPLSAADKAAVAGKIAWLTWDSNDATRRCGSVGRGGNVREAGGLGALFTGDVPVFAAGISGDPATPDFQLTLTETQRLQAAVDAGTLNITFTKTLLENQPSVDPSIADLLSSFSSRGPHGSIGVVKPDVTAPGDTISSAGMGTGNKVAVLSGTSMATPHAAGIAALVVGEHPTWTPEQIKAAVMNTADADLYTGPNHTGDHYGPARVGAGRVDALFAAGTDILAYSADNPGGVSASFGVVEVPADQASVTKTRTITVQNTGSSSANLTVSYDAVVDEPGVSYQVSPSLVTLAGGASTSVTVTLTADGAALRHSIDPTMKSDQSGLARQFVSDASGRLLIAQSGMGTLRVPVYGAVKPVSVMTGSPGLVDGGSGIKLDGTGFDQGTGGLGTWTSLVSVMDLGAVSPQLPSCADDDSGNCTINQTAVGGDIQYVGAGSAPDDTGSLENGWLWFAVATYGDAATIGNSTIPYVDYDVNGDGVPDFETYAQNLKGTDVLLAWTVDLNTGKTVDVEPVNFNLGDVDTNVFDSNVVLLPVWPGAIGITDDITSFPITYTVGTQSAYATAANGDIDDVGPVAFDPVSPGITVDKPLWVDEGGTGIPAIAAARNTQALVVHLHNASGTRAQVVALSPLPALSDVGMSDPFYDDITWLLISGISTGNSDGTFGSVESTSRQAMAAFLYRFVHRGQPDATCTGSTRSYTDVNASNIFCGDIEWLRSTGITDVDATAFLPIDPVTRQAMAAFLYRLAHPGGPDAVCSGPTRTFNDVGIDNQFCGDIEWLAAVGISTGWPDHTFRPALPIERQAMAHFLHMADTIIT